MTQRDIVSIGRDEMWRRIKDAWLVLRGQSMDTSFGRATTEMIKSMRTEIAYQENRANLAMKGVNEAYDELNKSNR